MKESNQKKMKINKLKEAMQDKLFMKDIDNIAKDYKAIDSEGCSYISFE
jgi:hypothetical protein